MAATAVHKAAPRSYTLLYQTFYWQDEMKIPTTCFWGQSVYLAANGFSFLKLENQNQESSVHSFFCFNIECRKIRKQLLFRFFHFFPRNEKREFSLIFRFRFNERLTLSVVSLKYSSGPPPEWVFFKGTVILERLPLLFPWRRVMIVTWHTAAIITLYDRWIAFISFFLFYLIYSQTCLPCHGQSDIPIHKYV